MSDPRDFPVYQLLFQIVSAVVDHADKIVIKTLWEDDGATFSVVVHPDDTGKLIGTHGRMANSVRIILSAIGLKLKRRFIVIIEE